MNGPKQVVEDGATSAQCSRNCVKGVLQGVFRRSDVEGKTLASMGMDDTQRRQVRVGINQCCGQAMDPDFENSDVQGSSTLDTLWADVESRLL